MGRLGATADSRASAAAYPTWYTSNEEWTMKMNSPSVGTGAGRQRSPDPDPRRPAPGDRARQRLLAGLRVEEKRMVLADIPTAVLEGGEGPPLVLLHGPGESAVKWLRVIPEFVKTHRLIAPDLPGHGASGGADHPLDTASVLAWLRELIERTCPSPPTLVGHVIGGAIGARFAAEHGDRLARLVLVDSLGLASFRPSPRFALAMIHYMARPSEHTYDRFMRQCSYDLDGLRKEMGDRWEPFVSYNLDRARAPGSSAGGRLMRELGLPRIPPEDLERITVPTTLIWGRHDRANRVRVAEDASARYGWPLHVIEECADDPPRDEPAAFLEVLNRIFEEEDAS
jgi:pimeloyl-ACP methyl ester carboxylesterase